jgi:putative membrane protein
MTIRHSLYDAVAGGEKKSESDPRPDLAYSRTHLANQRTYAAWLRTGLSIAGAGLVLAAITERAGTFGLGALFVSLGATAIVFGAWSFHRVSGTLKHAGTPSACITKSVVYGSSAGLVSLLVFALFLV